MRLFFAINLPDKIKTELDKIIQDLKEKLPRAKWVDKDNIHLTIKFLGDINDNDLPELIDNAKGIAKVIGEFNVNLTSFDLFPPSHPRIIYITLQSDELIEFAKKFISQIDSLNFVKSEHRGFLPHITLARIKEKFESEHFNLLKQIKYKNNFKVSSLDLMSSELTPKGPIYTLIKSFPL